MPEGTSVTVTFPGPPVEQYRSAATLTAMRALSTADIEDGNNLFLEGSLSVGDGGGGPYYWDADDLSADDDLNVIRPNDRTALQAGRWKYLPDRTLAQLGASSGSTLVKFLAGAATTPITVSSALIVSGVVSPLSYGAIGNGNHANAAIDTAAINACLADALANGWSVNLQPAGYNFIIDGYLDVRNGHRLLYGTGGKFTYKTGAVSATALLLKGRTSGEASNVADIHLRNLNFDLNGQSGYGVYGQNCARVTVEGCSFTNFTGSGAAVFIRSFTNGVDAAQGITIMNCRFRGDTGLAPTSDAILILADIDYSGVPLAQQSDEGYWKANFTNKVAALPISNVTVIGCDIEGGYYGVGMNNVSYYAVVGNRMRSNIRAVALSGCRGGNVTSNLMTEVYGSAVHLAYGSSDNLIEANSCYTTRAAGEGLFQAYVGCDYNDFIGNRTRAAGASIPLFHGYVAIHSNYNRFLGNTWRGSASRAYMGEESAWSTSSSRIGSRVNTSSPPDVNNYAAAGASSTLTGNVFDENLIDGDSVVPAIARLQVTDALGAHAIAGAVTSRNSVSKDSHNYQLYLLEETSGSFATGRLMDNGFNPNAVASKFNLPRGRSHFSAWAGNTVLDNNTTQLDFGASDTTPSVAVGFDFRFNNGGATSVTMFDDGVDGQEIRVRGDSNTTIVYNSALIRTKGAVNIPPWSSNGFITFRRISGIWFETSRSF